MTAYDNPVAPSWPRLTAALLAGRDLSRQESAWAMDQVMAGTASDVQLAGFLIALRAKGESVEELRGLADGMLAHARQLQVSGETLDIVGTGGDGAHTINVSTMSAIVAAGAGARVVKHGNRAASSSSGSADVLERLGVRLDLDPAAVARVAQEAGITFAFAQTFHPSMRFAAPARRELGLPTAFNVLGPLTNPARPTCSAIGVASEATAPIIAGVLADRGMSAAVFRGDDGLDELTLSTTSQLWWIWQGRIEQVEIGPEQVGLTQAPLEALRGGSPEHNAQVVRDVLDGRPGPARDAVLLNTGAALAVLNAHRERTGELSDQPFGSAGSAIEAVRTGIQQAADAIDSGAAAAALERWIAASGR